MNASSWATPSCRSRATRRRSSSTAWRMFAASSLAISRTAPYASADRRGDEEQVAAVDQLGELRWEDRVVQERHRGDHEADAEPLEELVVVLLGHPREGDRGDAEAGRRQRLDHDHRRVLAQPLQTGQRLRGNVERARQRARARTRSARRAPRRTATLAPTAIAIARLWRATWRSGSSAADGQQRRAEQPGDRGRPGRRSSSIVAVERDRQPRRDEVLERERRSIAVELQQRAQRAVEPEAAEQHRRDEHQHHRLGGFERDVEAPVPDRRVQRRREVDQQRDAQADAGRRSTRRNSASAEVTRRSLLSCRLRVESSPGPPSMAPEASLNRVAAAATVAARP